ncbi:hypothetical protein SAM19_00583 [Brevibacillus laterosporus]|nr:hypothetical protein [Brevibacillus laterosporus]
MNHFHAYKKEAPKNNLVPLTLLFVGNVSDKGYFLSSVYSEAIVTKDFFK